jgi:hypothetical protein
MEGAATADVFVAVLTDPEYAYKGTLTEMGIALGAQYVRRSGKIVLFIPKGAAPDNFVALCVPHTALADIIDYEGHPQDAVEEVIQEYIVGRLPYLMDECVDFMQTSH